MIRLFRIDGLEIMLSIDAIKEIRTGPPTTLALLDGELLQVKNTPIDVMNKVRAERLGREDEERQLAPPRRRPSDKEPDKPAS